MKKKTLVDKNNIGKISKYIKEENKIFTDTIETNQEKNVLWQLNEFNNYPVLKCHKKCTYINHFTIFIVELLCQKICCSGSPTSEDINQPVHLTNRTQSLGFAEASCGQRNL